jgi:hypothetical protein
MASRNSTTFWLQRYLHSPRCLRGVYCYRCGVSCFAFAEYCVDYGVRWLREVGCVSRSINVRNVFRIFVRSLKGRSLARPGRMWKDKWPLRSRDSGCELHSHGSGHVEVANTSGHSSLMNVPEIC